MAKKAKNPTQNSSFLNANIFYNQQNTEFFKHHQRNVLSQVAELDWQTSLHLQ